MKRNIFKALMAIAVLALTSCSMSNTVKNDNGSTNKKEAYITIGLNQADRTALPTVSGANDFDSFKLTGIIVQNEDEGMIGAKARKYGSWSTDSTSTAYEKMTDAKIAVYAGETYTFTLTAIKGGAAWQGKIEKTIETGENSLSFSLAVAALSDEGKGSLKITLSVPQIVKAVDAELKTMDETKTVTPENAEFIFANGKATYTASDIAAGNYVLVFTLWGDEERLLKLNQWREYAGIADGLTSSSNPVIKKDEEVGEIYQIKLEPNGGTLNGTCTGSYTRFSDDIWLPFRALWMYYGYFYDTCDPDDPEQDIYRDNYLFEGWYDDETEGNFIQNIPSGSTGDITLWAHWTDTFTVDMQSVSAYTSSVNDFGQYLEKSLQSLLDNGFDGITLKLINMEDANPVADWRKFVFLGNNSYKVLSNFIDDRFTKIFNVICAVQGNLKPNGPSLGWGNGNFVVAPTEGYTYDGLSINLDLSETSLTYLPAYAFADTEQYTSGLNNISTDSIKKPVNLIGITLPESLTALLPQTFNYTGFTKITIPKNVTFMSKVFSNTNGLIIDFEKGSRIETINAITNKNSLYKITIPASVKEIKDEVFALTGLTEIAFEGTKEQWKYVKRGSNWCVLCPIQSIICSDGEADLDYGAYNIIVVPTEHGGVTTNSIASTVGTKVTLSVSVDDGYYVDSLSVTAGSKEVELSGTDSIRAFSMPESDVTITAAFKKIEPIIVKGSELDTLKDKLNEMKDKGISSITVKITDMEDAIVPMEDWSTIDITDKSALSVLMNYVDERFTTIFDAIYDVQGEDTGLGVKLDLSETKLSYIPFIAFADMMSGENKQLLNLIEIKLPQNLTALLPFTFAGTGLTEITIPKTVTYMSMPCVNEQGISINFEENSRIQTIDMLGTEIVPINTITIPSSVKEIKDNAFNTSSLKEISFETGSQLETIGKYAFAVCDLKTITLPVSLKSIGDNAFDDCNDLETINFAGTVEQWVAISRGTDWHKDVPATTVTCSDGEVDLDFNYLGTKLPSEAKKVGDIILSDGSAIPYSENLTLTDAQKAAAVAVIFYVGTAEPTIGSNENILGKKALGVGIHNTIEDEDNNKHNFPWADNDDDNPGYITNFSYIQIEKSNTIPAETPYYQYEYSYSMKYVTGDFDGSDNWIKICEQDTTAAENAATNYPAFNWVNNYSSTYNLTGWLMNDWYLPSGVELHILNDNKTIVNASLTVAGGTKIADENYWSSSQYSEDDSIVYAVDFKREDLFEVEKYYWYCVCAIREFN